MASRKPRARAAALRRAPGLLTTYNRKRDFGLTSEPRGERPPKRQGNSYVIQQHDATRMHFDFRLELDGVLKSWAVPKGPSLSTADKRLAVMTEDHPVSYRDYEGVIPEGQYGGGPVIVWDRGTWEPERDPQAGLEKGSLSFILHGEKLQGRYSLVRLKGLPTGPKSNWLLLKRTDEHVRTGAEAEVTARLTRSVISGRTVQEIGAGAPARKTARAKAKPDRKPAAVRPAKAPRSAGKRPPALSGIEPQLATLVDRPPADGQFVYEMKFDGYRMLAHVDGQDVRIRSRNDLDWTALLPGPVQALRKLGLDGAVLDGELCYVMPDGKTDFQRLQGALRADARGAEQKRLTLFLFDLLFAQGEDLRAQPLAQRKEQLRKLLPKSKNGVLRYSEHLAGDAQAMLTQACTLGLEGLIGKRIDAPYRGGRGKDWIKLKCNQRQEFVIVGMTAPEGSRSGFGALLLAQWDKGALHYRGKVGTGFSERTLADLTRRLAKLQTATPPVKDAPRIRGARWVRPELVGEVSFTEVTRDGSLRHPSFQGLREDKPAGEVRPERAVKSAAAGKHDAGRDKPAVGGVRISNPDRVMDQASGLTKLELVRYHDSVSERFLRFARNRPLALVRCPQGDAQKCFFQKHVMPGIGDAVLPIDLGDQQTLMVESATGVLQLVQFNAVEFHGWGSLYPKYEKPDWIIFDLDPDTSLGFDKVVDAALEIREALAAMRLKSFVKTTGGKGLHVVVPLQPVAGWDEVRGFCQQVAVTIAAHAPERYVANMSKDKRKGKIFVDYLRNGRGATAVLPYSPRARPGATVAVPVAWTELRTLDPREFTVRNAAKWLSRRRDPWAALEQSRQRLPRLEKT
ncbi:MAG TPA: DNA ligase D [Solimonas sp.]|nr:DNA ligase D [Solimonas sp.]